MSWRRSLGPIGLLAAIGSACLSWGHMESMRSKSPAGSQALYLPSGKYLKITSFGFPEVMADLIYIWSIQYYSHQDAAERFKYLEHIYTNVISELDPLYVDPYLVGAMIMSMEANDDEMALRLLDKGIAANPDEWILAFNAGFLCYDRLKDYPRAVHYFELAVESPRVPSVVRRLRAEMYNKMGDKRSSLEYWREILQGAQSDYIRNVSSMHVHDLTIDVDLEMLRGAVAAWREKRGGNPPDLSALARAGLVRRVPLDPEGSAYLYDHDTGEVKSRSRFKLHHGSGRAGS